jgi:hypothetical protein
MSPLARLAIFLLPIVVFVIGSQILPRARLKAQPTGTGKLPWWKRKPLNQRLYGYRVKDVREYWGSLNPQQLGDEEKALQKDLFFPVAYAGALAVSSFLADRYCSSADPGWRVFLFPVTALVSDWAENLIQLRELARFRAGDSLESGPIHVASVATTLKLLSILGAIVLIGVLLFFIR